jgi:threonylcarbamoyladenosine tRNA methylthiotransferase MtaB
MTVEVVTFGCRLNTFESELMKRQANAAGLDDVVVVNTCAVTSEAVRQARQTIRRLKRERPSARIVVTGCAAQTEPAPFAAMPEIDRIIGNDDKLRAERWSETREVLDGGRGERIAVNDIMAARETAAHLIEGLDGHTRTFVQVQNGCDHRCTFCIIPYGRGPSRSVPMGAVVAQIRELIERGYREIVLTGVDLTSYGADLPGTPKLGSLVKLVLRHVPELMRLRLSSLDAVEVDADLLDLFASAPRLMPHLHLSLQHGDDLILKRMKRRHSRGDAIAFCAQLRKLRPDVVFGADIIAGFPTETEAMFAQSLALVDDCGLSFLHVFPFSPRPGTPAARMPQLPRGEIKERARRLRARGAAALHAHLEAQIGTTRQVLVERNHIGRTEQFTPVKLPPDLVPGRFADVHIVANDGERLIAAG